jgi:hypothetical protein
VSWYWDERKGKRLRHHPGVLTTARRLLKIGAWGFAGVGGLVVGGGLLLALWDATIGIVLLVLAAVTGGVWPQPVRFAV